MNDNPTDVKDQFELGENYWNGYNMIKDPIKAAYWYTKAAEQDFAEGQFNLGVCYAKGNGVPRNAWTAVNWYTKAAEQGEVKAQFNLGLCYEYGTGVSKDKEKAKSWFRKAADQGHQKAKEELRGLESGCYVATCIYGSYDCPEVWILRRYRDSSLSASWLGRWFIRLYYAISPKIVAAFGSQKWFNGLWKPVLDKLVRRLQKAGIDSSPYTDRTPIMAGTENGGTL